MAWIDPRAEEYLRRRFTRADAYRFAPPGSPEAKMPGWIDPSATRVRLKEAQEEEARARAAAESWRWRPRCETCARSSVI